MGVSVDYNIVRICSDQFRRSRAAEFVSVAHVDADSIQADLDGFLKSRVSRRIGVAVNGLNWRNDPKLIEYLVSSYIASVKNEVDARERLVHVRPQSAVSVRYKPDYKRVRPCCHAFYIT